MEILKMQLFPEYINNSYVFNKEELTGFIRLYVNGLTDPSVGATNESQRRHIEFLDDLVSRIKNLDIPEVSDEDWILNFSLSHTGAILEMYHLDDVEMQYSPGKLGREILESITLISMKREMVSIKEYAKLHSFNSYYIDELVERINELIEKGRIRNAQKVGEEWRIPESEILPSDDKYVSGQFTWFGKHLDGIPKEFEYLKDYDRLNIKREYSDTYRVVLNAMYKEKRKGRIMIIDEAQRQKLEFFLLSRSDVNRFDDYLDNFRLAEKLAEANECDE